MSNTQRNQSIHQSTKRTLVEQFGWTVKDEPGRFTMIAKELLQVDPSYQRQANTKRILGIASEWSWIACGTLSVASRDGEFYVMDGQHRKIAADKRYDIQQLPCMVWEVEDVLAEAQGFLDTNVARQPLRPAEKFSAMLTTGDADAIFVAQLLEESGLRLTGGGHSDGSIRAVGALLTTSRENRDALAKTFPLIAQICATAKSAIPARLIRGAWHLERTANGQFSLAEQPWRSRLLGVGLDELIKSMSRAETFYAVGGGEKVWAAGIANAINRKCRTHLVKVGGL